MKRSPCYQCPNISQDKDLCAECSKCEKAFDYALDLEDLYPPVMDGVFISFQARLRTFTRGRSSKKTICAFAGCGNPTNHESQYCDACRERIRRRKKADRDALAPKNAYRKKYEVLYQEIRQRPDYETISVKAICREYKIGRTAALKIKKGEY